jgi:hypothetical protein
MKRSKGKHLGEGLNEIIKKQEKTDVNIPGEIVSDNSMHDIVTGEKLENWSSAETSLTIVEELEEEIKKLNKKLEEKELKNSRGQSDILFEKVFKTFKFKEKGKSFEIVIDKKNTGKKKLLKLHFWKLYQNYQI